jgi:hypothetical protein
MSSTLNCPRAVPTGTADKTHPETLSLRESPSPASKTLGREEATRTTPTTWAFPEVRVGFQELSCADSLLLTSDPSSPIECVQQMSPPGLTRRCLYYDDSVDGCSCCSPNNHVCTSKLGSSFPARSRCSQSSTASSPGHSSTACAASLIAAWWSPAASI